MKRREKLKATAIRVPQNRDEAAGFIAAIGEHQRDRQVLEAEMNEQFALTKSVYEGRARAAATAIGELKQGLEIWAAANREVLTDGGKSKTAVLATGEVRWRMTPPAVTVKGIQAVLEYLFGHRLDRFVRVKHEIDKEALLREPEMAAQIPGLSIGQREEFVIVPFETKLEEVI